MATPEWVLVTLEVITVLDGLGVDYVIGGSAAAIIHGTVRTTLDTDIVADLKLEHVDPFSSALSGEFYVESESMQKAIAERTSFNLIHQTTMFKVDIFIPKDRSFDKAQLARRISKVVAQEPQRTAWVLSAENVVLAKLEWFRMGNEASERQWRDVLGVLKTQFGRIDVEYMRVMATTLGVSDLLEHALDEATK